MNKTPLILYMDNVIKQIELLIADKKDNNSLPAKIPDDMLNNMHKTLNIIMPIYPDVHKKLIDLINQNPNNITYYINLKDELIIFREMILSTQ